MKTTARFFHIILSLVCIALLPKMQAVLPAPDGGYPGGNTAEGQNALFGLTTGGFNTAVGYLSLRSDTTNSFNTAIGAGALLANVAGNNTATGAGALFSNTTGPFNTGIGALALFSNTTGASNTAIGEAALFYNTTGENNTAHGATALAQNTTGFQNTAIGLNALNQNTTGANNTGIGAGALELNTIGSGNVVLGAFAGSGITTANNVICIGAVGNNVDQSCYIGNIFGATSSNGVGVLVNSNGRLGTMTSSRRFKQAIKPMDRKSEAVFSLKPVTFRYKKEIDPDCTLQFGLVAEDVEKVNRDLVVRDEEGKPYSVRYDQVNAMLLNEFLKEHKKVEELNSKLERQEATITELNKEMATMIAHSKEQDSKIQRVSTQVEVNSFGSQVAQSN
jgi:trimeric autotransporter adhesin